MPLRPPPPVPSNPLVRIAHDVAAERRATVPFPPGWTRFSMRRTTAFSRRPLPLLLEGYERFGPVFTIRVLHGNVVFMLGAGLLTIDGEFHRRSRMIMLPAFHRDQIARAQAIMDEEVARAIAGWREG